MLYRNAASNYGTHIEEKSNQRPGLSRQIPILPGAGLPSTGSQGSWATGTGTGTGKGTGTGLGLLLHPPQVGRGQRRPAGGADALSPLFTGIPFTDLLRSSPCWAARGHLLLVPPTPALGTPQLRYRGSAGRGSPVGTRRRPRPRAAAGAGPGAWGSPWSLGEPRELGGAPGPAERGAPGGTLPAPGDGR